MSPPDTPAKPPAKPRPFRLRAPVPLEFDLQYSVVAAFNYLLPRDAVFTAWDLSSASRREVEQKKRRGCAPAWPDMGVFWRGRAVLIELKRERGRNSRGGTVSGDQEALHGRLAVAGFPVVVCRTLDEVLEAVAAAGIHLRGRALPRWDRSPPSDAGAAP